MHILVKEEHADSIKEMVMKHDIAVAKIREEHIRAVVKSNIQRRWMQTTQDMKLNAFRKWREVATIEFTVSHVAQSILEPHTAMIYKDIKKKIKAALQHQFKIMPREKTHILLIWSVIEPVLYYSNLNDDLDDGAEWSKRGHRTRRVSTLELDLDENVNKILQRRAAAM